MNTLNTIVFQGISNNTIEEKDQITEGVFESKIVDSYIINDNRASSTPVKIELEENDLIELEFDNGFIRIMTIDQIQDEFPAELYRSNQALNSNEIGIPSFLEEKSPNRGWFKTLLRKLNIIRTVSDIPAKAAALKMVKAFENRIIREEGLFICQNPNQLGLKVRYPESIPTDSPILILIHGTASNTKNSFGGFIQNGVISEAWKAIQKIYDRNIYAFEHLTISKSPLENATELLKSLPSQATVHTISHSRGGLISDLLTRNMLPTLSETFTIKEINNFIENEQSEDVEHLRQLNNLFQKKEIKITKSIRVACPTSGTLLAGKRLDLYLTIVLNSLRVIPGFGTNPIYSALKELLTGIVRQRNNTEIMPGLEAMNPESIFIELVNSVANHKKMNSELIVIAGDVKSGGFLRTLSVFLTDVYYRCQHDFVVNSISMFGGLPREKAYYKFYSTANISHFSYFINKSTQDDIKEALEAKNLANTSFKNWNNKTLESFKEDNKVRGKNLAISPLSKMNINKPTVYVLPGIMGSKLEVEEDGIWLNYFRIAAGELDRLRYHKNQEVKATEVMGVAYRKLLRRLRKSYNVVPFPYDWRAPLQISIDRFAEDLKQRLDRTSKPIHIMAHSMGGLVVHGLYNNHKDIWTALNDRLNNKVIFLGTPFNGSYDIPNVYLKKNSAFKKLHRLDLEHNSTEVLDILSTFPGILELLPNFGEHDFFNIKQGSIWDTLKTIRGNQFIRPSNSSIKQSKKLGEQRLKDPIKGDSIVYIAGKDNHTPAGFIIKNNKISLLSTSLGDGKVTWDSAISKHFKQVYYIDVKHGDLCDEKSYFKAFEEIMDKGETNRLSTLPIHARSENDTLFPSPEYSPGLALNTQEYIECALLEKTFTFEEEDDHIPVKIDLINGDLGNATFPLIVGHHEGDALLNAESIVDGYMDKKLKAIYQTNVYPGAIRTSLIMQRNHSFPGCIVIGLGRYSELNEKKLQSTLTEAIIKYGQQFIHQNNTVSLGISTLLVGTYYSGMSISLCIRCILKAIKRANKNLKAFPNQVYINQLEIIELYKDKSIQAVYELKKILREPAFSKTFSLENEYLKVVSGSRKRFVFEDNKTWWHRLQITKKNEDEYSPLKFISLTDKARAEAEVKHTQINLIEALIKNALEHQSLDKNTANTLFQLLIPNNFKDYIGQNHDIILIVDKFTAKYPWEILHLPDELDEKPMSTRIGIIRQLITQKYNKNVNYSLENKALIIGNPKINLEKYEDLPGAKQESITVANILKENRYKTVESYEESSVNIINKLFQESYKVIHLAGHGILNKENPVHSGMVLDNGLFISVAEIESLRHTPDFVFINCCHIGKISKSNTKFNELAATLGLQLIEKGVKAVICAGWAISDNAAEHFSKEIYRNLFEGYNFGNSVRKARMSTFEHYSNSNTWAAYQCYGNPFFKLSQRETKPESKPQKFIDPSQVVIQLENIQNRAEPSSSRDREDLKRELEEIINRLPNQWLTKSILIENIANCYYELSYFKEAILYYHKLKSLWDAKSALSSLEKLSNIETKQTIWDYQKNNISKQHALKEIERTKSDILNLLAIGETERRFALVGGHHKRRSMIEDTLEQFKLSREGYLKSIQIQDKGNNYSKLNVLTLNRLILLFSKAKRINIKQEKLFLSQIEAEIRMMTNSKKTFWEKSLQASVNIYKLLNLKETNKVKTDIASEILNDYREIWDQGGSYRKSRNILNHLRLLITLLSKPEVKANISEADYKRSEKTINILTELKSSLEKLFRE